MPSQSPIEWLQGFGKPTQTSSSRDGLSPFSVSVILSDRMPLNVNLTGALIENVMGYLDNTKRAESNAIVPHLIRNSSGMTLRFREVLDTDRAKRRENSTKIILANGSEAPLTLKRSLSQTCDPHRAFIYLELGGFKDTIGSVNHGDIDIPKGVRSANFLFKASAKIPVDAVGIHRYPLDRSVKTRRNLKDDGSNSRALGWIIVRVALRGSVKVVSIESPFVLKSAADADLLCEVRDENGLSLLWRCLVPKEECFDSNGKNDGIVSVPADIVPLIHDGSYRFSVTALSRATSFSHEAEIISTRNNAIKVSTPPPFSPKSFARGLIGEEEIVLPTMVSPDKNRGENNVIFGSNEKVHLTACAVRIGSVNFSRVDSSIEVPEQRMIFFRSPLVIRNFLALPIAVQVRVKTFSNAVINDHANANDGAHTLKLTGWEELGVLDCGESVPWTGSPSSDQVELRVKFVGTDGDNSRRYPGWSSQVNVPARGNGRRVGRSDNARTYAKMKVYDADNVTLNLSVAFDFGNDISGIDQSEHESIRHYSQDFSSATRAASIFVPYWIIDGTHQDLEFFAGSPVAGQLDRKDRIDSDKASMLKFGNTSGLAELMDNQDFLNASSGSGFDVLMVGDEDASRLSVRKRLSRNERLLIERNVSPWSDSIPLQVGQKARHDITVLIPDEISSNHKSKSDDGQCFDRLVLRSSIVDANNRFGGQLGTKLIHIVNRYLISNETGRDIEIAANTGSSTNLIVSATTSPQPFHFDDSRQIRFRFKEFGWAWSGLFKVRLNRREVTMRIRHKMKGQTIIVTVEVRSTKKSATNLIVFRESSHPPFRLENHTMYPLSFGQAFSGLESEDNDCDSLLLQYQNEDFAWDEPELSRRALLIKASGTMDHPRDIVFGKFALDKIAPGTVLKLDCNLFTAEVVADGPTRVLRVSDASMPRISSVRQGEFDYFRSAPEVVKPLTTSFSIKMSHGIGVSVVDFSPKELLYICLEDIDLDKKKDCKKDDVRFSIGNIKVNNQLWVTPYPVFLKMGHRHIGKTNIRRKSRRHNAISLSWRRSLNTHGGYGNLTLLDWIEVSSEPIFANVDGELAGLLVRMARQVASISSSGEDNSAFQSRDEELKSLLTSSGVGEYPEYGSTSTRTHSALKDDAVGELLTTAAIAAKLRDSPAYNQHTTPRSGHYLIRNATRKRMKEPQQSKAQHKFYIERLKISTTRADLSWSGVLPGLLSSSLFKALTFERLPMRLRPFSNLHAYGNIGDHLQFLRSHYMSIWRVVDVLMGLSSNPTFLFRGVFHSFREGYASVLDSWALCLRYYSTQLTKLSQRDYKLVPTYDDGNPLPYTEHRRDILKTISSPFVNGLIFVLKNTSLVISLFSLQMKYSPKSSSARRTRGLVRSRNPRLFAHLGGKDLLVEYVEGENAGKALLSRVRSGLHLGEGYFYHAEGVRQLKSYFRSKDDIDPAPLILMITLERILLLTGKLDQHFCSVKWEAYFTNIIHIDLLPTHVVIEGSTFPYDEIILWYLSDPEFSVGNKNEKTQKYAKNLVSGIDVLHSKSIFVPRLLGEPVLEKLKLFESCS
uniref:Vacuolar protein sorting-associated protein 13 VPS13 adaptor binding domain-containing protein n=1 Tax=Pseudo-nitzschia australis TaxID=44445 RepID=A0A7S4AAW7_9STRA